MVILLWSLAALLALSTACSVLCGLLWLCSARFRDSLIGEQARLFHNEWTAERQR